MQNVRIVADSGCDLSPELAAQHDITLVPVFVRFGQEVFSSDELTSEAFWRHANESRESPGTTSPAPGTFRQAFAKLIALGHDVVCLTLPAKHSGTYNAAWLASQEFGEKVRVVDTGSFSLGMGLQVLAAARAAIAGHSAEAIQRTVEGLRARTSMIFVLDTLEWVRRGGRLDRILPLVDRVARTFHVKPVMEMANGEFRLVSIARSARGAVQKLEEEVRARLPVDSVAAAYTRGREAACDLAARLALLTNRNASDIQVAEAGPAFAAHAGANAVGAAVIRA